MPINPSQIAATPLSQSPDFTIELVSVRPSLTDPLQVAKVPGQLVGFYNNSQGVVELYIVDTSGLRLAKVV